MKKFSSILCVSFLVMGIFQACSNDQAYMTPNERDAVVVPADQNPNFMEKVKWKGVFENMSFGERIVRGTYDSKEQLVSVIMKISDEISANLGEDESIGVLVNINEPEYVIHIGAPVPDFPTWGCPEGYESANTCFSQGCVENTLTNLASDFGSGDNILIHHGGLGGVSVCFDDN